MQVGAAVPSESLTIRLARRALASRLERLRHGGLEIVEAGRRTCFGGASEGCPLVGHVEVRDARFYPAVAMGGAIGAGEAYRDGYWESDDLAAVVRVLARNREALQGLERGFTRLVGPFRRLAHRLRANTRHGSRRNVGEHYDLGNEFYQLFLDPTLMYSCAVFAGPEPRGSTQELGQALAAASEAKLELICRKLELGPEDEVLEIGTGWGGFALHAASRYGCRVVTTTISQRQLELARARVEAAGLGDRVEVVGRDYRDLSGRFDKLVSIEMIEAVGHEFLEGFFRVCSERLKPHGRMLIQAIVVPDQTYDSYRRSVDFIQRHIFPGALLPSIATMMDCVKRATDLRLEHLQDLTPHYATTLRIWCDRFLARRDEVRALGFSDAFVRLWEFYFRYCEGGFEERVIGDVQMLFAKPLSRQAPVASAV